MSSGEIEAKLSGGSGHGRGAEAKKHKFKRPEKVYKYLKERVDPDQLPPDYVALLSLLCGICGLMLKYKLLAWFALFFCLCSIATVKQSEMDMKQLACTVTFAVMGLVMNYFTPSPSPRP